jgi:2-C-methyl-D-erythritol 4-phosphate cytidylyltransferase/2-C-methyl-D-erythritol 2,4-cyclodiphosphate synthase
MTTAALIVAAGRGLRAGGGVAKQWRALKGRPVADWTLEKFLTHPRIGSVVLVLNPDDPIGWDRYGTRDDLILARGGAERALSVRAGLRALAGKGITNVLIHDVARPCIDAATIDAVIDALASSGAAAPALPVTDALWTGADGEVTGTRDRTGLFAAQTPQGFRFDAILAAHETATDAQAADDVAIARASGLRVAIVEGNAENIKITTAADFDRAARILGTQMDIRLGNGYDVHRFAEGDHVTLCGVKVPHDRSLDGHSDADVGMHAVTDAIYGALAEGDIGRHFPPSDPQWKGAASEIFLRHAVELAASRGFAISNVDCTLVCEYPKIGPHAGAMQAEMARIMGLSPDRVSVKATTSERLGFTGRGEGIAALATACLVAS